MALKDIKFTILLDEATNKQLLALKHAEHMSKGAFIRALINRCATMTYSMQPTCADGQRCMCPQMHAYTPAPAVGQAAGMPPDPDLVKRALYPETQTLPVRDPEGPPNDPEFTGPHETPNSAA